MAPDFPPSLAVIDLRFKDETLTASVEYIEVSRQHRIRFRWNARSSPKSFISIGNGVAFIEDSANLVFPPKSDDVAPDDLGNGRYRWVEGLRQGVPWATLILILPAGYSLSNPSPQISAAKVFRGRIAVYWTLRGNQDGHTFAEWCLYRVSNEDVVAAVQKLLRDSIPSVQNAATVQIDTDVRSVRTQNTPASSLDPLDDPDAPQELKTLKWLFTKGRRYWKYGLILLAILVVPKAIGPAYNWTTGHFRDKSTYTVLSDWGFSEVDTSICFSAVFNNKGVDPVTISNVYISAADSSSLHQGWRGECAFFPQEFEPIIVEGGRTISAAFRCGHAISAFLDEFFPEQSEIVFFCNFITRDPKDSLHWSKARIGTTNVLGSRIVGYSIGPIVKMKLVPARLDVPLGYISRPREYSVAGPVLVIPPGQRTTIIFDD